MGGKSDPPPPPDYSGVIAASQAASAQSAQIARRQLAFAQRQFRAQQAMARPVVEAQTAAMTESMKNAAADRAFWERNYQPVEERLTRDAMTWDDPANMERRAAQAGAEVATQYAGARSRNWDTLKSYGVDPSQAQMGALDLEAGLSGAAATAQAINTSRDQTRMEAVAMRQAAAATGRGLQQVQTGELGQGVSTGATTVSTGLAPAQTFMNATMNPLGFQTESIQSLGQAFDFTHGAYGDMLAYEKAKNDASSGIMGALGTATGIVGGKYISKFATGGSVGADYAPPAAQMNLGPQGGAIPPDIGGPPNPRQGTDTVHALLTPGEYVIPKDVAMRRGTDALDKYVFNERIKSAQQRMEHLQAIPTIAHPQQPQPMPGGANIPPQALPMVA